MLKARWLYKILSLVIALGTGLMAARTASTATRTVWRIGRFDHSAAEFSHHRMLASRQPLVYVVGKSTPKAGWPAFQPGSSIRGAVPRTHAYTIQFNLPEAPRGQYTLKLGFLTSGRGRLAILQAEINGHTGWAYQQPVWRNVPGQKHWQDVIRLQLPASDLKPGANRLVLTAIDAPSRGHSHPGLTYDALELDQNPGQRFRPGEIAARAQPTIFYRRQGSTLDELVDIYVRHNAPLRGRVELKIGGRLLSARLVAGRDFGEEKVEFAVPEFAAGARAELMVASGRQRRRFALTLTPAKKWTIYLVPHEHLDVGYTDYQAKVAELQSRVLDEAMAMIHEHPDFRYSTDGYWVYQQFFSGRSAADRQKLLRLVQAHKLFVPAQYANLLTEFPGVETLIRSLYPSFQFYRQHGGSFDYANDTDVPTYTWSYPSILAAVGVKYFLAGSDQTHGPVLLLSHLEEQSPFWWQGPDGARVLMWYSYSYGQVGAVFGLPPRVSVGRDALPRFLQIYSTPTYKPHSVLLFGAQWENSDLFPQQAALAGEWNRIYAYPKLVYAGFAHALGAIARQAGSSIPTFKGDGGPYWEDGIYSDARHAIEERKTEQRAPSAEKIATLSSILVPHVEPDIAAIRRLWQNMLLFDEHTWGAAGSVRQPQSQQSVRQLAAKDAFAARAVQDLNTILERGLSAISSRINDPAGTLVVFNPLNWKRSGLVEVDLQNGAELVNPADGRVIPFQVLSQQPGYRRIRFVARSVPSVGYKCYRIQRARSQPPNPHPAAGAVLENAYYRIVLDPASGAVKSIFDKQLGRELVNTSSPYRFDQYLYATRGGGPPRTSLNNIGLPMPKLTVHGAHGGRLLSIEAAPFGTVARLESADMNTPRIETTIILFNAQKKIEFINRVVKKKVYTKEAAYFAFPLAMDHPQFRYDIQNGVVNPAHDLLPGAAKEWFSVQHWVAARQAGATAALIPIDAELFTLGDIVRGRWPMRLGRRSGTIFSYIMNNYWFTNYVAGQGGEFTFRYVFTSGRNLQPAQLSRKGWEEMTPLETNWIIRNDKISGIRRSQPLNADAASFLNVSQPNVVLVNWKRAEDGRGTILRFLELAGEPGRVKVDLPVLNVRQAWLCNAMEQDQARLTTSAHGLIFPIKPFQIVTLRVVGEPVLH